MYRISGDLSIRPWKVGSREFDEFAAVGSKSQTTLGLELGILILVFNKCKMNVPWYSVTKVLIRHPGF